MRCDGCKRRAPTRFAVFGKAIGMVIASQWERRPADLCAACMKSRCGSWTGLTAVLGWWGLHSFAQTLRFIPANLREYRRAMRTVPLPDDPSDAEIAEATASRTRILLDLRETDRMLFGALGVLFSASCAWGLLSPTAGSWDRGSTMLVVFGSIAFLVGGALIASAMLRRREIAAMTPELLARIGEEAELSKGMKRAAPTPPTSPPTSPSTTGTPPANAPRHAPLNVAPRRRRP